MALESRDKKKKRGIKRLYHSFQYAFEGFLYTLTHEQNMLVHLLAAFLVILVGIILKISITEWLICFLFIGLVMAMELLNTSIEAVVDLVCPEKNKLAKIAKDTAAGAVMVFAFFALLAGILIFLPKIFVAL